MTKLGIYIANQPDDLVAFETWLGRPVDTILVITGERDWPDWHGSIGWCAGIFARSGRELVFSVPLIPGGAALEDAARGAFDAHYKRAAQEIARRRSGLVRVRTGWEFNGTWMKWAAPGRAETFVAAFRHFVSSFRSVSDRFRIEWCVNTGDVGMDPETAYPGDAYVDVIGMDFYVQPEWPADPEECWNFVVTQPFGLQWHLEFARGRGKAVAYSEWGVDRDRFGPYVERAAAWFESSGAAYNHYWQSNTEYAGKLGPAQHPSTSKAFRAAFGARP